MSTTLPSLETANACRLSRPSTPTSETSDNSSDARIKTLAREIMSTTGTCGLSQPSTPTNERDGDFHTAQSNALEEEKSPLSKFDVVSSDPTVSSNELRHRVCVNTGDAGEVKKDGDAHLKLQQGFRSAPTTFNICKLFKKCCCSDRCTIM